MSKGIHYGGMLCDCIQAFLRSSGHSQKELAAVLGLHPKVLSRKLNGSGNSHLTHLEVRVILVELTRWHGITTQDDAFQLLELAQVGPTLFDPEEWNTPPLNQLQAQKRSSVPSDTPAIPDSTLQHNIPAPTTRLIGREWAVERLRQLFELNDARLVTLVGPGGSGKTRLALHVAHQFLTMFEQGVWFVALAGVRDPALVPMSIIQALNIKPTPGVSLVQSLCTYLRNKKILLVLDNFEQVAEATNIVDEMLAVAPGLKVLVTSRSILHLYGESVFVVPSLDIPASNVELDATQLVHYEAIQLFFERAQAVMPSFAITHENKDVIVQICAKVDGLPLAIELAAARVRVLSPALLLKRLSNARLAVLTGGARNLPGRQQTLRNTIAWSYDLLSPDEQVWFPRLSVFSGSWPLEAAEAMMQQGATGREPFFDSDGVLNMIEQLVDNSLLARLSGGTEQARFMMLETLREYAWELLNIQEELEQWRDWHACYYLELAEAAELGLRGPQQRVWLERLTLDRDNFRAALEWSLQRAGLGKRITLPTFFEREMTEMYRDVVGSRTLSLHAIPGSGHFALEVCLRLASALRPYWEWQGYLIEGRDWLSAAISVPLTRENGETVLAARAKALSEIARLVCLQDEQTHAIELVEESIALWHELDDPSGLATALLHRGWTAHAVSDYKGAERVYQQGLQVLEPTNELWLRAQLLCFLGGAVAFQFDTEQAKSLYRQSREIFEQVNDKTSVADVLKDQGGMLILEANYAESIACLLKSIGLCYELGHKQFVTTGLGWLSFAIGLRAEPDEATASLYAAQLQGATQSLMDAIGMTHWSRTNPFIQAVQMHLRSRANDQEWEVAWNKGRALTAEQAIELAYRLGKG